MRRSSNSLLQRSSGPATGLMIGLLLFASVLAGCVTEDAPGRSPPTLIEAHQAASRKATALDPSAQLAGFYADHGIEQVPVPKWLLDKVGHVPDAGAQLRSGHAAAWVLLYVTSEGRVLRALVQEDLSVDLQRVVKDPDPVAQALWGMNLGGRLLTDSDEAVREALRADPRLNDHADAHPEAPVAVASTIASVSNDAKDLVYAVYWGPATEGSSFSRFAYVHHFTGEVVRSGEASQYLEARRVMLVDEEFTMGPVPREAYASKRLEIDVEDAVLSLTTSGAGHYTLRLLHGNETEAVRIEGAALAQEEEQEEALGTLEKGEWVLHVEVTGRVGFHLQIEGVVPTGPGETL